MRSKKAPVPRLAGNERLVWTVHERSARRPDEPSGPCRCSVVNDCRQRTVGLSCQKCWPWPLALSAAHDKQPTSERPVINPWSCLPTSFRIVPEASDGFWEIQPFQRRRAADVPSRHRDGEAREV
jgi:hypothetical protein